MVGTSNQPIDILKAVFGFTEWRGQQKEVVEAALNGQHTLVLMPTGMGKSLCFQLPSQIYSMESPNSNRAGFVLVISPLIALMKDQVDQAIRKGIRACFINSSLTRGEREERYAGLKQGIYDLVYVTPERFRKQDFRDAVAGSQMARPVQLLAIDEAHCVSQWGHDFRPDYSRIKEFRELLGNPTTMALTATATPEIQKDIIKQVGLTESDVRVFAGGMQRPNLAFSVIDLHGEDQKVQAFVAMRHLHPGPAIVYFSLIQSLEKFARQLFKLGIEPIVYHGDLADRVRRKNQDRFLSGEGDLILATPAFGLGVDKAEVRLIVHGEMPGSIESYYQEAGRAGRDGNPAACVLLFDNDDVTIQNDFLKWANPDPGFLVSVYDLIERNPLRWEQQGFDFLREQMNYYNRRDFRVETSVNQLERWGFLEFAERGETLKPVRRPEGEFLDSKAFDRRLQAHLKRLDEMVNYSSMESGCRQEKIYTYFGLRGHQRCGICDLCGSKVK